MVLQKQVIPLPFGGLQTKVDPKIAPFGTYEQIDNFIMDRYPELKKRNGLSLIGQSTVPSNINANYNYLNEMGVITNNSLYSYSSSLDQFQLKGLTASPIVTAKPIISNTYTQTVCDSAVTTSSIIGAVWEDSRGGVRYSIKDVTSDTFLSTDQVLSATGTKPKAIAIGTSIFFLWCESGSTALKIAKYSTITNSISSSQTVTSIMAACYTYDIIQASNNILIAVVETGASPNAVTGYYWNANKNVVGGTSDGLPVPQSLSLTNTGTLPPALSLAIAADGTYIIVSWINDSKQVYTKAIRTDLSSFGSETQVSTAKADDGWAIASCVDTSNNTYIFYSTYNTAHTSYQAKVTANTTSPSVSYNSLFYVQFSVASRAFWYSGNAYVVLGYDSSLQATYFGVRDDGACFARMFATLAGGSIAKANCVTSINIRPDKTNYYLGAFLKTTKVVSSANSFYTTTSVFTEQIFFTPASIDNKVLGKYLNIAGGYLKQYDGSPTIFEQGFHLYPEQPSAIQSTSTGSIANGTYSYIACWEWTDNQGQIHRSNTSVPVTITTTGANNTVTLTVKTLPITNKETRFGDTRTPVVLAIYRTQSLGTTYYRVNQLVSEYVYNDPTATTITYVDGKTDAQINSNSLLYTTGGVFSNIGLPSTNLMTVAKNRVVVAGTDTEPNRVYFSKEKEEGVAIEFSNELSIIVDGLGGDITALAAMDDKILIFKKSLIFYVAGQGPDKLGNGSFTIPLLISADCGCTNPQSIVLTGKGIMFLSQKGIYLVDRQLGVNYIGQALDAITTKQSNFQITSAVNLPDQNQVFFTTNGSQTLVYDTFFEQWYTHTLPFNPISSTVLNNTWYASSTSSVYQSVSGLAYDGTGSTISSSIRTNWISLGQVEGFQRIYAILILGSNANLSHTLKVNLYYDFEDFPRQTLTITPTSLNGATFGADSPYGSGTPFGSYFDGTYQFVVRPKEQKCSSIKIEILDQFPTGTGSTSFNFSGLSIVAGIKSGWNRNLPYNRRLT